MNCNVPTDICFSFAGFCARGGQTDDHQDGWGIAFFEGAGCRLFVDEKPSVASPVAGLVKQYPIHSKHVICPYSEGHSGANFPRKLPPLSTRTLGTLLGLCPQWRLNQF